MIFITITYLANLILLLLALVIGFLAGRLWQILFSSPGMTLDQAIQVEREIRRAL
jgi:hypothetical protein